MGKLTDSAIKNIKPAEKPIKLFDGGGLFLLVHQQAASCGGRNTALMAKNAYWRMGLIQRSA